MRFAKAARSVAAFCVLCTILLSGCSSLFSGDTTVILPKQEKLLPSADYEYTDEAEVDQYDSSLPAAFYIPEDCAFPLISFDCLDYLKDTGEFLYAYQAYVINDDYRAYTEKKADYEEKLKKRDSEYTNGILLDYERVLNSYEAVQDLYNTALENSGDSAATQKYTQSLAIYTDTLLPEYYQQLRDYIEIYWPGTGDSIADAALKNSIVKSDGLDRVNEPLAPQAPEMPSAPVLSGDIRMVTRLVAYNYQTQKARTFFEQESGANSEQSMFVKQMQDSGNYFLYFAGHLYFYRSNGKCYRELDLTRAYKSLVKYCDKHYSSYQTITIQNVDVFSEESTVLLQTVVELTHLDENTEEDDSNSLQYLDIEIKMYSLENYQFYSIDGDSLAMYNAETGRETTLHHLDSNSEIDSDEAESLSSLSGIGCTTYPDYEDYSWVRSSDTIMLELSGFVSSIEKANPSVMDIHSIYEKLRDQEESSSDSDKSDGIFTIPVTYLYPTDDSFCFTYQIHSSDGEQKVDLGNKYWMQYSGNTSSRAAVLYNESDNRAILYGYSGWYGLSPVSVTISYTDTVHSEDILSAEAMPRQWSNFFRNAYMAITSQNIQICESSYMETGVSDSWLYRGCSDICSYPSNRKILTIPLSNLNMNPGDSGTNPEIYSAKSFYFFSRTKFYVVGPQNGLVYCQLTLNSSGTVSSVMAKQVSDYPLYRIWRLADGSYIAIGFNTEGKRYTMEDMPKAYVLKFTANSGS